MQKLVLLFFIIGLSFSGFSQKLPVPADKKATRETVALFQSLTISLFFTIVSGVYF